MSFQHPVLDLLGGWENVQLMLGAKQYSDEILGSHSDYCEERVLVFDFEPVSEYYRGIIEIKYYGGTDYFVSTLSVKVIYTPYKERTPISRVTLVSRSELSHHIKRITGRTLSF